MSIQSLGGGSRPTRRVQASTLEELFELAGFATFDLGWDLTSVTPTYPRPVVGAGDTAGELLACWIEEFLTASRTHGIVFCSFAVDRLEEGGVQGSAAGLFEAEVPRTAVDVVGLAATPEPIEVPDGWWVDLSFRTERRLRSVD